MILRMKLLFTGSPDCPSGLPAAPFSFQLPSARWPRYITTRTLLPLPLWTGAHIWMISQPPQHMPTISSIYSSKLRRWWTLFTCLMCKWATNSTQLQDVWRIQGLPLQTETQVLGMDWETLVRHDPHWPHEHYTGIAGTTSNKAPSTTSHDEILRTTRIVFASGTCGKTHFPRYVDTGTPVGRVTTAGYCRKVVIMDDTITSLVWHVRSTMDRSTEVQIPGLRGTCFRRFFRTCIQSSYIPQVYHWWRRDCPTHL